MTAPLGNPSFNAITSAALRWPAAYGVKRTLNVVLAPAFTITGKVVGLVMVKSAALVPVNDMPLMV